MIEMKNVTKTIGDRTIIHNLNATIHEGMTVALLGPNGAGKSTLLKLAAGLLKQTEGEVVIGGQPVKEKDPAINRMIGFLSHETFLYDSLSPYENLLFYGKLYSVSNIKEKAEQLLNDVGLSLYMNEPVKTFSKGMKQRAAIARAILHSPRILFLDEPHSGLDQKSIDVLNQILRAMKNEGTTIVLATHDFQQAASQCERAIMLANGKMADDFSIEIKTAEWLKSKYIACMGIGR